MTIIIVATSHSWKTRTLTGVQVSTQRTKTKSLNTSALLQTVGKSFCFYRKSKRGWKKISPAKPGPPPCPFGNRRLKYPAVTSRVSTISCTEQKKELPRGQWPQVLFWPFSIGYFSNWCVDGALLFKHTALYIIFDTLDLAMCIQTGTMGNPKSHI